MKIIGMIGGLGPESTIDYYKLLIAAYLERVPDGTYPHLVINSINLRDVVRRLDANDLDGLTDFLVAEVERLANAGAEVGFVGVNTPHIVFDELSRRSSIPLVSIVEATAEAARAAGLKKLGLIGSRYTMQGKFFREVFTRQGIELAVPDPDEQTWIHDHYMNELVKGIFLEETRQELLRIVGRMREQDHIQGLILGGTELPLILRDAPDCGIPFLDTARIHVNAVMRQANG